MSRPNILSAESTPAAIRALARQGLITGQTAGLAPGFAQGNLAILPGDWAEEFLAFCRANPKPCPLMAAARLPQLPELGEDIDIRTDLPRYQIFRDGVATGEAEDIAELWDDSLAFFLIGCSFTFERALLAAGLPVRHVEQGVNVPMFRTSIPTRPAGRFGGNLVVSMRPLRVDQIGRAIEITGKMPLAHGAPIHVGDPGAIGIGALGKPDFGDPVRVASDEVPVFWACGVTAQLAIAHARPPLAITHAPGCMLVTDIPEADLNSGRFVPRILLAAGLLPEN